jgi:protein-S-isoprenylcysteine O-methyltransferase Ste14
MQVGLLNLWILYVLAYAVAFPLRQWANAKRGEPIEDPVFLAEHKAVLAAALAWLAGGFLIGLFVPIQRGPMSLLGLLLYLLGLSIGVWALYSFAYGSGLITRGAYRYSRNPNYVGWTILILGLTLIGWSPSPWSVVFLMYFAVTIPYFHWTVLLEERYLSEKHGEVYREYLRKTPRYIGAPNP